MESAIDFTTLISEEDLNQIQEWERNRIASTSNNVYLNSITKFFNWLYEKAPAILKREFIEQCLDQRTNKLDKKSIGNFMERKQHEPMFFSNLNHTVFMCFLAHLRTADNGRLCPTTYQTYRSALYNLCVIYNQLPIYVAMNDKLKNYFSGISRAHASRIRNGQGEIKKGKEPLPFDLYRILAKNFLQKGKKEIFAHTFMVMCWNLMCRASNAYNIKFNHMEWRSDALCIYFAQMKNDQTGSRPRDPRHIYANPLMPEICPILSLGFYWLTYGFVGSSTNALFPGTQRQDDRFRNILADSAQSETVLRELENRAMQYDDLETLSIRKGAATYASSGSIMAPSAAAINLRAGWKLGGVQDTFLRYDSAADMYVGRVVAGLPIHDPEFDVVGPFLQGDDNYAELVRTCFIDIPDELVVIGGRCLASLVYHYQFISQTLDSNHPVRRSTLFTSRELFGRVARYVKCTLDSPRLDVVRTGIPPHCELIRSLRDISDAVRETQHQTISRIIAVLEQNAVGAGAVTSNGLHTVLNQQFSQQLQAIQSVMGNIRPSTSANVPDVENSQAEPQAAQQVFHVNGRLCRLPADYKLPDCGPAEAFRQWCFPNTMNNISALKDCDKNDYSGDKRRFGEFQKLMREFERYAHLNNLPIRTESDIGPIISNWIAENISPYTPSGRPRTRISQMKWTNILKTWTKEPRMYQGVAGTDLFPELIMDGKEIALSLNALGKLPDIEEPEILNAVRELAARISDAILEFELTGKDVAISLNALSKFTKHNEAVIHKAIVRLAERIDADLEMNSQNISNSLSGLSRASYPKDTVIQDAIIHLFDRIVKDKYMVMNGQDISNCLNSLVRIHERFFCCRRHPVLYCCFLVLAQKIITEHERIKMKGQEVANTLTALSKFEDDKNPVVVEAFLEIVKRVSDLELNGQEMANSMLAISKFRDLYGHTVVKKAIFKLKYLITHPVNKLNLNGQGISMSLIALSRMNVRNHVAAAEALIQMITPDLHMKGQEIANSLNSLSRLHPENEIVKGAFVRLAEMIHKGLQMNGQNISMSLTVLCKAKNVDHPSIRIAVIQLAEMICSNALFFTTQGISNCLLSLGKVIDIYKDTQAIFIAISNMAERVELRLRMSGLDVSNILQGICKCHELRNNDSKVNHAINVMISKIISDNRLVKQMTGTNVAFSLKALGSIAPSSLFPDIKEALYVLAHQIRSKSVKLSNLEMDIAVKALIPWNGFRERAFVIFTD